MVTNHSFSHNQTCHDFNGENIMDYVLSIARINFMANSHNMMEILKIQILSKNQQLPKIQVQD